MDSEAISLVVITLTIGVSASICVKKFRMSHSLWCSWGTAVILDSLRFSPNKLTASAAGKRILNPYCTRCCNYPRMNAVILGVYAEVWGPFLD